MFVSAVGCYLQMVLKAVVATTRAVVVATTSGCDLSTTPDPALPTYLPYPPAPPGLGPVMADVIARLPDWRDVALLYDDGAGKGASIKDRKKAVENAWYATMHDQ